MGEKVQNQVVPHRFQDPALQRAPAQPSANQTATASTNLDPELSQYLMTEDEMAVSLAEFQNSGGTTSQYSSSGGQYTSSELCLGSGLCPLLNIPIA